MDGIRTSQEQITNKKGIVRFQVLALMMDTVSTSGTSVSFYETIWHDNPEDSHLQQVNFY
jgi:hypothetical protein